MEMQPCPGHRDRPSACFGNSAVSETRKLAAILVADIVGYSRLAGADEDRILARLRTLRSDLIDPILAVHDGRVVKRTGDGAIVEFRSVVDAVRCAIEVQSGLAERNAGLPPEKRIEYRVGIHLGDAVEEEDGDLMGDGVNIAARLEGVASPGTICLSEQAYWQVKGRLDLKVTDLGATQLKNIAEPIHVYSLEVGQPALAKPVPSATPVDQAKAVASARRMGSTQFAAVIATLLLLAVVGSWYINNGRAPKPAQAAHLSVVVRPFTNLSGDPAQDYFADGVTENLTTELSRIRDSFVIARNTAFTYKGKNVDAKEIGKELGVRYVLEGSVQRDQGRVRVNTQLVDAETGAHLWADRFEEDAADLFKLHDQVVARLASALGYELVAAEAKKGSRSVNPDVTDLAMQGWTSLWRSFQQSPTERRETNREVRALFDRALQIDPKDADSLAGSAYTYAVDWLYGWGDPGTDYEAKAASPSIRIL
jgi:adenylate cyclase